MTLSSLSFYFPFCQRTADTVYWIKDVVSISYETEDFKALYTEVVEVDMDTYFRWKF